MKICLVTAFPPSRHGLNEYGFHIARELGQYPGLSLSILADDLANVEPELPGYDVTRCWAFDALSNPVRLMRAISKCQPDVVWFNLGFASFGSSPVPAFIGLAIPAMVRFAGYYTHVTLHQLVETVDLTAIDFPPEEDEFRWAGLDSQPAAQVRPRRVADASGLLRLRLSSRFADRWPIGSE